MPKKKKNTTSSKTKKSDKSLKSSLFPNGWKELYQGDTLRFLIGMLFLVMALFMLLAFTSHFFTGWEEQSGIDSGTLEEAHNYGGRLGAFTAQYFMDECFGVSSYFIPIFMIALSVKLMRVYKVRLWKWFLNCSILMVWSSVTLGVMQGSIIPVTNFTFGLGGMHGQRVSENLMEAIGLIPTYLIVFITAICYLVYLSSETIVIVRKLMKPHELIRDNMPRLGQHKRPRSADNENEETGEETGENEEHAYNEDYEVSLNFSNRADNGEETQLVLAEKEDGTDATAFSVNTGTQQPEEETTTENPAADTEKTAGDIADMEPYDPRKDLENYKFPSIDLLKKYSDNTPQVDMAEQNANKDRIITVLKNFGVEIQSIKATIGPTITLYEITPAPGVRINKIRNLEDDIALSLSALGIRIIAPIPGKGTIGIEVPNKNPRIVSMESIINSKKFQESTFELPIALGKTITNDVYMVDLAKMPHLLVAGATGQGKSVGLNAIITSLVYKKHPSELKLVMVDPKKVEFSIYSPIENHFLAKIPDGEDSIITDVTKVVQTLKSLCQLMDHRYDLLKKAKVRNVKEYNAKFKARQLNPENGHSYMPYIVIIIDEFGDLIMTAGKEVELPIARIAQLARAVGMHMVIATQRPTTNIITGTIKANFPARMAFKVMSRIDSQTILDRTGANQLVGKGDMLFLAGNEPVRVQCAFVDTPEVERINNHIACQQGYLTPYELPEVQSESDNESTGDVLEAKSLDPMFEEAARLIIVHQLGSTSLIQRKFSIGYNRAGRLMDQLERAGIVGPTRGAKPREVLCSDETELETILSGLR